jgi:hypothetical protein
LTPEDGWGSDPQAVDDFDDVREDYGSEGSDNDDWDVCAVPTLFTTATQRRVFSVQRVVRVGGNHRPSFEYFGCVVEPRPSTPAVVVERELTLCLRYTHPHRPSLGGQWLARRPGDSSASACMCKSHSRCVGCDLDLASSLATVAAEPAPCTLHPLSCGTLAWAQIRAAQPQVQAAVPALCLL